MRPWKAFVAVGIVLLAVLAACQKELSADGEVVAQGKQKVNIYLTDDPALFDSVVVNILAVKARVDTCSRSSDDQRDDDDDDSCEVWFDLNISAGMYDLLRLRNGIDTLLATGTIPQGKVEKVKLVLGTGHYLVKDSIRYPLNMMPGRKSEIMIKLKDDDWDRNNSNNNNRVWLDFDVAKSIIRVRDGQFYLLPVVRPFSMVKTGAIKGKIMSLDAMAVVSVYNSSDTAFALPDKKGEFKIRGLKEGTYSLFVNAGNNYRDTTISNIAIRAGKETDLKTITLKK